MRRNSTVIGLLSVVSALLISCQAAPDPNTLPDGWVGSVPLREGLFGRGEPLGDLNVTLDMPSDWKPADRSTNEQPSSGVIQRGEPLRTFAYYQFVATEEAAILQAPDGGYPQLPPVEKWSERVGDADVTLWRTKDRSQARQQAGAIFHRLPDAPSSIEAGLVIAGYPLSVDTVELLIQVIRSVRYSDELMAQIGTET